MTPVDPSAPPLTAPEFANLMAAFAPFEPAPRLAVAVSGGADSMALALLARSWATDTGGDVVALTVDHRLRPEAAAEAAQVAQWMAAHGIPHHTLVREGPLLRRDVQAAARAARYRLLEAWCAEAGVLHLLTAHHAEDQAETLLLRLARGSGLDGLAGMAALVEHAACRVLRPLLGVSRARLRAGLAAAGQGWIEDPSNRDPAYARSALRAGMDVLEDAGLTVARLAATAGHLGRARAALEAATADLLAWSIELHPWGFARLDPSPLATAPAETALRALAALVATVAGSEFPPRFERLAGILRALSEGLPAGRTLGGCRFLPRRSGVLVCREAASVAPPLAVTPGGRARWDGRFAITLPAAAPPGLAVGALAEDAPRLAAAGFGADLPAVVRATLPAFRDAGGVAAVPALGYARDADQAGDLATAVSFKPTRPLTRPRFTVV